MLTHQGHSLSHSNLPGQNNNSMSPKNGSFANKLIQQAIQSREALASRHKHLLSAFLPTQNVPLANSQI
jgi:hypothetical protein